MTWRIDGLDEAKLDEVLELGSGSRWERGGGVRRSGRRLAVAVLPARLEGRRRAGDRGVEPVPLERTVRRSRPGGDPREPVRRPAPRRPGARPVPRPRAAPPPVRPRPPDRLRPHPPPRTGRRPRRGDRGAAGEPGCVVPRRQEHPLRLLQLHRRPGARSGPDRGRTMGDGEEAFPGVTAAAGACSTSPRRERSAMPGTSRTSSSVMSSVPAPVRGGGRLFRNGCSPTPRLYSATRITASVMLSGPPPPIAAFHSSNAARPSSCSCRIRATSSVGSTSLRPSEQTR